MITFIQANAAIVKRPFIDQGILGLVAIQSDLLNHDAVDVRALEQRKVGGNLGGARKVEPFLQAAIEFEPIAP